jgi:thioredoxin-related protein
MLLKSYSMNNLRTMKRILFFLGLIATFGCTQAQTTTTTIPTPVNAATIKPPKANIENQPAFHILTKDSVLLTNANLPKNKAVMFVYFSPDCSHCQRLMYELKPEMKHFSNLEIVMVTFTRTEMLKMLKDFSQTFNLKAYPNLMMGTEYPNYTLQRYFQVQTTPYIAIYDTKGKLVKAFDRKPEVKELVAAVKGI